MGFLALRGRFCGQVYTTSRISGYPYPLEYIQRRALSELKNVNTDNSILPVLIVGAGPVGLVLSILLTKLGVKCAVLEKNRAFSRHPQAHFINNRSMEVFRKLDGLADEVLSSQPPVDLWRKFIYCTSLTGQILGAVDHMQPQDFDRVVSPVSVAHFSQYKLVRLLLKNLIDLGFNVHNYENTKFDQAQVRGGEILMGHKCVSLKTADHGVTATASFLCGGRHIERDIHCQFLVGTDGAGSTVRKLLGVAMEGEKDLQKLISIHFLSEDLGKYLINERPGMLFFIFNPEVIGVLVAHDLKQGEFVLQVPFYPPQQNLEDFSFEMCERLILKLVGRELPDIDVRDVKPWVMHAEVAEKFVSCSSRIILAGDAAHRFPPAGGFGMNTGIQDAHNLAWKIASVLDGITSASFVSTYEMERKPIASFNTALSVQNFKAAMGVPAALGLDPKIANAVHRAINDTVGSILPHGLQRSILDGIFTVGRAQLSESLLNEKNPLGSSRLAKLRQIFEEGKSLQLQFPAEDLGFRYLKGALAPDGNSSSDAPKAPTGHRREYIPSADPGSRLPHMNIRLLSKQSGKETLSTLDLVSVDRVEFVLIIAPLEKSYHMAKAAFKVAKGLQLPIKICVMWPSQTMGVFGRSETSLAPWTNFIDVVEEKNAHTSDSWWDICQMKERGAILVRPDEHIAWRIKSEIKGNLVIEMNRIFCTILGVEARHTYNRSNS